MVATASIVNKYDRADAAGKVDIICKNYSNFIGIVDSYTEGLCYMIINEKKNNLGEEQEILGVRVQTSGIKSDPTAKSAIDNVVTKQAIVECDFSGGMLEGVDRKEELSRVAYILRNMRTDYELFNRQLESLEKKEARIFLGYLSGEKNIGNIAEEEGIQYESAAQRVRRIKLKVKVQMVGFLEGNA